MKLSPQKSTRFSLTSPSLSSALPFWIDKAIICCVSMLCNVRIGAVYIFFIIFELECLRCSNPLSYYDFLAVHDVDSLARIIDALTGDVEDDSVTCFDIHVLYAISVIAENVSLNTT